MELSTPKTTEAKKLKCTVSELVFADLLSIGYSEMDAYSVAFPEDAALSVQLQKANIEDITKKTRFKHLCEERRKKNESRLSTPQRSDCIQLIGAEDVAKEILLSAKSQPVGSKERADLMAKYNDIRKNNEQTAEDVTESIQFYLPVKCNDCPLLMAYNEWQIRNKEREIRPVEMEGIIRKSSLIIQQAKENENH